MVSPTWHKILIIANKNEQQFKELERYLENDYDISMIPFDQGSLAEAQSFAPDLVIVDNIVSGTSGIDILQDLRNHFGDVGLEVPKLLFIARMVGEITTALDSKVDDCLIHPFTPRLVLERARHLLADAEITVNIARRVFENSFEGVALFSKRDNKIVYANPQMLQILDEASIPLNQTANTLVKGEGEHLKLLQEIHRVDDTASTPFRAHLGANKTPCNVYIEPYNSKMFIMFAERMEDSHAHQLQYENLMDKCISPILIYKTDDTTRHIFKMNQAVETLLGYSHAEIKSLTRDKIVISEQNQQDVRKKTEKHGWRYATVRHKQGHEIEVKLITYTSKLDDVDVLVEVFEDISKQNEYKQAILNLQTALDVVAQAVNLDELIQVVVDYLCEAINATAVNCMMIENRQAVVVYRKTSTLSFNVGTVRTGALDLDKAKALKWMVDHKKLLYIADVEQDDRWYKTSQEYWLKSYLGLPIVADDKVVGFINADGARVDQFSQAQIEHATLVIAQLGKMIHTGGYVQQGYKQNGHKQESPVASIPIEIDYHKHLDKQLGEQLDLFQQLLDNLPVHMYIKNRHGRFIYMNSAFADTLKLYFDNDQLIDIYDEQLNWGEDYVRSYRLERDIFTTKQAIINDDVVIVHPETGKEKRYLTTKTPIFSDDGEVLYVAGIDREITVLQRTLDHVVNSVNCILWYADIVFKDGNFQWTYHLFSEAAAQRLLPLDVSEQMPYMKAWQYAIFEEDLQRIEQTANNALVTEKPEYHYEFRCTNKYGDVVWLREDARVTQLSATHWRVDYISIDVTDRHKVLQELERMNEQLEARVKERTAALTQSNAQLQAQILERQRIESALREQERQYRTLTNQLPLGVYRVSLDGTFLYANDQFARMFGYDDIDELFTLSIKDFYVNPHIRAEMMEKAQQNPFQQQTSVVQFWRRDKSEIWIRANWRLVESDEGSYIDGIMEDITDTRMIQEIERDQRHFVEALQSASTDLNRTLNLEEVIRVVLKHINRIMPKHQTAGVMLIENDEEVRSIAYQRQTPDGPEVHPTNNTFKMRLLPNLVRMYESKEPIAISNTDISPDWQYVEVTNWIKSYISSPIVVAGEVIGFINLSSDTPDTFDMTHAQRLMVFASQVGIAIQNARMYEAIQNHASVLEKRVAERTYELEHKTLQLQTILDAMAEGVIYYNQDVHAQFSNRSLVEITGYSPFDLKHDTLFAELLQLSMDDFANWRQDLLDTLDVAKVWHGEYQLKRKDGKLFDAYIGASRVHDEQENFFGFVMVIRDISQEKHLERQRINFITQASHQLRTPITNLKTYLYLIRRQPEQTESRLKVIEEVTEHLHQLVESLLEITKSASVDEHLRRFSIPVQAPIVEVVESIASKVEQKGLTIETQLPDEAIYVSVDPGQIKDAFRRILDNAIIATDSGGKLTISADVSENSDRFVIKFTDTGVGIPSHLLSDIFTPFIRGLDDFSGVGIGLSIVKHIVTLHSGTVDIESVENEGTTVIVTLPIVVR